MSDKPSVPSFRFLSSLAGSRSTPEKAYEAGRSSIIDGPDTTNSHYRHFLTPELTAAWDRGMKDAAWERGQGGTDADDQS